MLIAERIRSERLVEIIKDLQRHRFGRRAATLPADQLLLGPEDVEQNEAETATEGEAPNLRDEALLLVIIGTEISELLPKRPRRNVFRIDTSRATRPWRSHQVVDLGLELPNFTASDIRIRLGLVGPSGVCER